jgi:prepilin-type N-terminal cleavage/methylation domain-containing protein
MLARAPHRRGFTLMEIMLVIAIILVLVALLVPALSIAKKRGRLVDNQSLLTSIANAIEQYETTFNTYPGPPINGMTTANNGGFKMSGTQALLLALSYTWVNTTSGSADVQPNDPINVFGTTAAPPNVPISFTDANNATWTLVVNPTKPTGPRDHGNTGPTGAFKALQPFYAPSNRELSPPITPSVQPGIVTWVNGGYPDSAPSPRNKFPFPTLLDHYNPPLPILYFRGTPGIAGTVYYNLSGTIDHSKNTLVGEIPNPPAGQPRAAFLRQENIDYLETPGFNVGTGITPNQAELSPLSSKVTGSSTDIADDNFAKLLTENGKNVTRSPKGTAFILMCAGEDRIYGTADDIIINR